ncbi:DUF924 family protein [Acidihalobacter ferrooxydans]|uniref:DUF924 domain-containing protein n=1 Tax=Acidihalobacter ferrooxydans TaxID=1765967 RepID=A0A1P8UDM9_9GAMM|nr:DUF924 family protein [Acidihalobacter ferrooxydans]APZ41906.1 hypothetical protein BW247_01340 [Acidihalobacter ferrooxydans]
MATDAAVHEVLEFWYLDSVRPRWFDATPVLDAQIRARFEPLWLQARRGELDAWANDPDGALALSIVLDQFPLNMFRGQPESFATEQAAVRLARSAVAAGLDQRLSPERRVFLYMPLMHSEHMADQDESVRLFEASGLQDNAKFARHHREIVRRFGRFPHRNAILGRASTPEEQAYLASDEAFTG